MDAHERLDDALKRWDSLWSQKFKSSWLKDGDRNSKIFHALHTRSKYRANILALEINGQRVTDQGEISNHIINFYSTLFNISNSGPVDFSCLIQLNFRRISYK